MAKERRDAGQTQPSVCEVRTADPGRPPRHGQREVGPEDLARELECSQRTVFRDIEILSVAGIPVFFDKAVQAYRVPDGFRFSSLDPAQVGTCDATNPAVHDLLVTARRVLKEADGFLGCLRRLCDELQKATRQDR